MLAPLVIKVSQYNCSICSKSGYLGMIIPRDRFTLKCGEKSLTDYEFDSGVAKHLFCKSCETKSFYIPRSHPDGVSVNARCLDPEPVEDMNSKQIDGKDWERYYPEAEPKGNRTSSRLSPKRSQRIETR
ncbi:MAG: GFA family protein [Gammaproteobacteria bacterium]|nr:GFA family protein [Gammaproteobacteria bacterium]MDH3447784.1 GFA family protein [Gammaproteobacteria bacterium]